MNGGHSAPRVKIQKTSFCYLDDIVIFLTSFEHLKCMEEILGLLNCVWLQLNDKKFGFATKAIIVLRNVVSKKEIQSDPATIASVMELPCPLHLKHLRKFRGLASLFYRFMRNFATIDAPLHNLLYCTRSTCRVNVQQSFTPPDAHMARQFCATSMTEPINTSNGRQQPWPWCCSSRMTRMRSSRVRRSSSDK